MVRLDLGSGNFDLPGYQSIDRRHGQEAYPLACADGSVEEIRASHLLEHWGHRQTHEVLKDWVRALKPGGILKIAVPDFRKIVGWYQEAKVDMPLRSYLFGGQVDDGDFHKNLFDEPYLRAHLQAAGLVDIKPWVSEVTDNASWEVSLNLQGMKPDQDVHWPQCHASNTYSQYGEDGMLEAIFNRIGATNKVCVDVGAADGLLFSNVRKLIESGWSGLLIESDRERFEKIGGGQLGYGRIKSVNCTVGVTGVNSLDYLLGKEGVPVDFDLLSIDVDGQDYYIWNSLLRFSPRVVVIEYSARQDEFYIPALGSEQPDDQAGRKAMMFVAAARGYDCVAQTATNLICIRKDIAETLINKRDQVQPAPVTQEPGGKAPKIMAVLSVPRLGFNANWHATVAALVGLGINSEIVEGAFWGQCLTRGIEKVLAQDADIILTIDYDSIVEPQHIVKLCQLLADNPEYAAIVPRQMKRESAQALFQTNGDRDFTKPLTSIATGHFGLTVFDKNLFLRMPKPWFHEQPAQDGTWGDGRLDADIYFWRQVQAAGLKVALANEVSIGHLELQIAWPSERFEKVFQSVSNYREKGQPVNCGGGLKVELHVEEAGHGN